MRCRRLWYAVVVTVLVTCGTSLLFPQSPSPDYPRELQEWRDHYVAELTKPDGWLSLAGLEWLQEGENPFGSAADNRIHLPASAPAHLGILQLERESVQLLAPKGGFPRDLMVDGKPAIAQTIRVEPKQDKLNPRLTIGSLQMYVIRRENRFALRIKDSQSSGLLGFQGLHWFQPNEQYRVTAKWIPYIPQKTVTLSTLVGTSVDYPVPGAAEFTLNNKSYRIEPVLEDPNVAKLFFILRDTTSSASTYPACRFLYTGLPSNGLDKPGELVLDFNHLENPPCAYTAFATCPLPPPGNRLPIALPVGEKRYHD
jgi:uncharacterized protein